MNINSCIIGGRLTRDIELRYAPSGTAVAGFGVAVSRYSGGKQETTFIDVTAFGKTAELAAEHLRKGSGVVIEGRLHLDQWDDAQGAKRSKLKVIAERVHFADKPARRDESTVQEVAAAGDDARPDDEVPF